MTMRVAAILLAVLALSAYQQPEHQSSSVSHSTESTTAFSPSAEQPVEADRFVDAIGAVSHFGFTNTPYVTQFPAISAALIASGIRHIRDGGFHYRGGSRLATLAAAGVHHSLQFGVKVTGEEIAETVAAEARDIDFVEPQNEYDTSGDPAWAGTIVKEQQLLYTTVRANPANAGVVVLGPSLARQSTYRELGNLDAISDAGNLHNATCSLNPGATSWVGISAMSALVRASTSKPIWTTETGYHDDIPHSCAIPDSVIAKYDPRTVAERFLAGEPRIYFYQLADMPSDRLFGAFGLIDASGVAKPQFVALASMISLLKDPGPSFATTPLSYTLSGATQNLHHLLLQKRNGTYVLMLWLEVPSWKSPPNWKGGEPITVTPQAVTISTAQPHSSATMYQYAPDMKLARTRLQSNATSYDVQVSDSISFLELN